MLLLCVCVCMWNVLCYVLMLFVSSFDLLILFFLFRGGRKDPFGDSQLGALLVAAWLPLQKVLQELGQSSWSAWCLRPLLAIIKENANMSSNAHKNICKCKQSSFSVLWSCLCIWIHLELWCCIRSEIQGEKGKCEKGRWKGDKARVYMSTCSHCLLFLWMLFLSCL